MARGLIIGGLLAVVMSNLGIGWELKLSLILVPAVTYLVMALSVSYPKTERVTSNVSTASMWREAARPLFLLLLVCMCMTAAIEMGPDQWFPRVMESWCRSSVPSREAACCSWFIPAA